MFFNEEVTLYHKNQKEETEMKKFVAMVMVMVVLMMSAVCAHAELTYKTDGTEVYNIGVDRKGNKVVDTIYYLTVTSESGESVRLEVTEKEYKKVAKAEKEAQKTFLAKVGSTLTVWNPND